MLKKDRPLAAVAGAGYWGKNLVRNFYQLGALKTVFDENPEIRAAMKESHAGITTAACFNEILNDPEVAGVALATPAVTHFELTKKALQAGKHVFVEKPLAMTASQGRELVDLAASRNLVLMVDHILQNHPAYIKLKELTASGALGRLRHIHSRRLSFGKIRVEEDVLWSFAPHDLSMVLGLAGRRPERVMAVGRDWLTRGVADTVEAHLEFFGDLTAQISVSWLNPVKEQRLVAIGDKKMAVFDDALPWAEKLKLYAHQVAWPGQTPAAEAASAELIDLMEVEPLKARCLDFLDAIGGGKKPVSDGLEGLEVLTTLEALSASLKDGGHKKTLNGEARAYFAHPTAIVDDGVKIGAGTKIWHFSHILTGSELGESVNIGQNVVVGPKAKVGDRVKIQNNVSVYEGVTLEDNVFCGPSMVFTNVHNPRANVVRKNEYRPTLLKRGASVGANATVVCGHTLGAWCFIGAGAVVAGDVPDYALMVGNPARQRGWMCRCGIKLSDSLVCNGCGRTYKKADGKMEPVSKGEDK
jgi:UDP-2-acetamido-3-amino-2,3-dideoxy-glucuronate N-acetyltransferase